MNLTRHPFRTTRPPRLGAATRRVRRTLAGILVITLGIGGLASDRPPASASAEITLTPVADTYVAESSPDAQYGSRLSLRVDAAPTIVASYLRFDLGDISSGVTRATLRLYVAASVNAAVAANEVSDVTWSEKEITYLDAPPIGAVVGVTADMKADSWATVDVTSAVSNTVLSGSPAISLALTGVGTSASRFLSRESGLATAPQLIIETGGAPPTTTPAATTTSAPLPADDVQPGVPMRGAFYEPGYPGRWSQAGIYPFTNYAPSAGLYDGGDIDIVKQQIGAMQYGNIDMAISSWRGPGDVSDSRVPTLLSAARGTSFRWGVYYEEERLSDPTVATLTADLTYLNERYGADPSALRVDGRFVVFVSADSSDACQMVDRWKAANTVNVYLVLKVFSGYAQCGNQPDDWHQYGPASAADGQGAH
ncbi:MAG: hypothetical protein JWM12_2363 [Ilumatobacteraceae bacterium]|nr:hypothetical protein [Ilumatobacteraceae bacterium]